MLLNGAFVGRRSDGYHNAVSPDMLLEQTYNADAKEKSGLDAITTNEAMRSKWVYTKHITSAASTQLKSMLHLDNLGGTSINSSSHCRNTNSPSSRASAKTYSKCRGKPISFTK